MKMKGVKTYQQSNFMRTPDCGSGSTLHPGRAAYGNIKVHFGSRQKTQQRTTDCGLYPSCWVRQAWRVCRKVFTQGNEDPCYRKNTDGFIHRQERRKEVHV